MIINLPKKPFIDPRTGKEVGDPELHIYDGQQHINDSTLNHMQEAHIRTPEWKLRQSQNGSGERLKF